MVIKLGMVFADNNVPDFGSIETGIDGALTLLDTDKSKLNSLLTRSGLASYLADGNFTIGGGTCAVIADKPAVWRYHSATDKWYEILPCDCGEYRVYFYNGSDLADVQTVAEGNDAVYGGETPTKPSDEQYSYTFAGWNSDPSAQTADSDALKSVYANRTVYAVFTAEELPENEPGE